MITTFAVVGEPAGMDVMDDMPVGSSITNGGVDYYVKQPSGMWQRWRGESATSDEYRSNQFSGGSYVVRSLPEGTQYVPRPQETVESYMNRFRGRSLQKASEHGVSYSASRDTIDAMGARRTDVIPLGPGVPVYDNTERDSLPEGTIIYTGKPDEVATFGVFEKRRRTWTHIFGDLRHLDNTSAVIHTLEGSMEPVAWLKREATDEDKERIAEFRGSAWRHGWRLKQTQSWCGTYENVMRELGLTAAALHEHGANGLVAGDTVSSEQAAGLPVGSVLSWHSATRAGEWSMFVRTNNAGGTARTVRVAGESASARNYRSSMRIVAIAAAGDTAWHMGQWNGPFFQHCSPGTIFSVDEGSARYIKCHDGQIAAYRRGEIPAIGSYLPSVFQNYTNVTVHTYGGIIL